MARYIDLDELLTNIDKRNGRLPLWLDEILMEDCKVADVAPVRHGHFRWLTFSGDTIICSECKMAYNIFETNCAENFNFCPNCGARMDGEPDVNGNDNKTPET